MTFQWYTSSDRLCRKGEITRSISRRQQRRLIISLLWYFRGNLGWRVVNALCFGRNPRDLRFQSLSLNGNNVNVLRRQKNYYYTWKYSRFTVCTFVGFFSIGFVRLLGLRVHINDVTFLAITTPQLPASFAGLLPSPATHFWRKWLAAFTTMTIRALKIRKTVSSVTSNSSAFRLSILKLKTKVGKKYLNSQSELKNKPWETLHEKKLQWDSGVWVNHLQSFLYSRFFLTTLQNKNACSLSPDPKCNQNNLNSLPLSLFQCSHTQTWISRAPSENCHEKGT